MPSDARHAAAARQAECVDRIVDDLPEMEICFPGALLIVEIRGQTLRSDLARGRDRSLVDSHDFSPETPGMPQDDRRQFLGKSRAAMSAVGITRNAEAAPANKDLKMNASLNPARLQDRFTLENSVVMLVDHQTGTIGWVKSQPSKVTVASSRAMARMALDYGMPLVMTTTMEENVGPTIPDLAQLAPDAYAKRYKRGGQLSCWDDANLASDVKALGRKRVILAGLTTDICLFWAATDAIRLGYEVMVVADACGSMSALSDQLTYDRLREMGVTVTGINQMMTELVNNFGTAEGQKAMKINLEEIISKLIA